jgi:hypothetical protein
MDLDWTHALPFGLLMFAGSAIARLRRRRRLSLAERNYPALAERLGLDFEPPRHAGWVGRLRGRHAGYAVLVEPDERPRIVVNFEANPGLDVRSYLHWKRAPEGYVGFTFGRRHLDERLPNRYCASNLQDTELRELAAVFDKVLGASPELKQFTLNSERIECVFDYGHPAVIPPPEVERLLPALVQLARAVETWR